MSDADIEKEIDENYRYANSYWAPFVKDAEAYTLAASGMSWSHNERQQLIREGREPLELNIMRRPLSFFSGWLRDNVNSTVYSAVEGSDKKTADQFTELGYYVWDKGKGFTSFLDAYDEAFKSGISLVGLEMDYSKDFINGDIKFYKRTYNSFYLDPAFSSIDLSDCGFAITRDLVSVEEAKLLLKDVIDPNDVEDLGRSFRDDKFLSYRPNVTSATRQRNLLSYDQYYRKTSRSRDFLVDKDSGFFRDITDLSKEDRDKLEFGLNRIDKTKDEFELLGNESVDMPNVEIRTVDRVYVELHIRLNGKLVYSGEDRTGIVDTYPFAPCICYMEPSIWMPSQRIQGMASSQWSAQREFNKRHMKIVDMMDSVISTGYSYIIGSVPDPTDLQQSGANRLIGIDPDAPQGLDSVRELKGGGADPALIQYQEVLDKLTLTLGNVTEASLGMDEKRNTLVSGRLAQVQIAQNLLANRKVFDNVDDTQQILGSLVLKAIQANYPDGKVERIINEEPTDQFREKDFEQYDTVVKEGVRSKSQKDAYYFELLALKRDGIVDVPQSEIIRALSMSGISDLEEAIKAQEEQQAEQQAKIQEQEELALKLGNAKVEEALALSAERRARVQSDLALATERISESEENRAQAALARAKTITEIAGMKEERILKVLAFVQQLEDAEISDREDISNKVVNQAADIEQSTLSPPSQVSQEGIL